MEQEFYNICYCQKDKMINSTAMGRQQQKAVGNITRKALFKVILTRRVWCMIYEGEYYVS